MIKYENEKMEINGSGSQLIKEIADISARTILHIVKDNEEMQAILLEMIIDKTKENINAHRDN